MPDWAEGWLLPVVIGAAIVWAIVGVGGMTIKRRAARRREEKSLQEYQQRLREQEALKAAQEACGLWSWWSKDLLERGEVYQLSEHNIPREKKEEQESWHRDGLWLAQTDEHDEGYYSCAACKRLMEAHIEDETHDYYGERVARSTPIGYKLLDGTRNVFTIQQKPGSI